MSKFSEYISFENYSESNLKILTKNAKLVDLSFNVFQKKVNVTIEELRKNRKPIRLIILKARQLGMSTQIAAYIYHQTVTNFFTKSQLTADDSDNTRNLFNMCKRFYDFSKPRLKPLRKFSNAKELVFENPDNKTKDQKSGLMSSIVVQTAGKETAGRSGTIHNLHCSEFAFWPNASTTVTGLFQSVPYLPGTSIFIESTANGISGRGEEFYNRWQMAKSGRGDFTPLFFPWWECDEYERDPGNDFILNDEEKELVGLYPKMNLKKLAWRRYKIENEMGSALIDPVDNFKQEFPACDIEAFISTGRPVFDIKIIMEDIERLKDRRFKVGYFNSESEFVENDKGDYRLFVPSEDSRIYAIGADIAEGLASGDFSTMTAINKDYEQVLSYHGHIPPDTFGVELCKAGRYLNECVICPESNNHGLTTITKIKDLNYPRLYTREIKDEISDKLTVKYGWQSNVKTKMLALDEFVAAYRDRILKINDIELLKEMSLLTVETDGNVDLNGKDRVVSAMMAIQAIKQAPSEIKFKAHNPNENKIPKNINEKLKFLDRLSKNG